MDYAKRGYHIFPVWWINDFGTCGCGNRNCKDPGKHPIPYRGVWDATTDLTQIAEWWAKHPRANIGWHPGPSGHLAIDLDKYKDEYDATATGEIITKADEETLTNLTGSGGNHLVYDLPSGEKFGSNKGSLPPGIDIRCWGGYIILPPSNHKTGNHYQWETGYGPDEMTPAPLPQKLYDILRAAQQTAQAAKVAIKANLPEPDIRQWRLPPWLIEDLDIGHLDNDRSVNDWRVMCALAERGLSDDDITAVWQHYPIGTDGKYADDGDRYLSMTLGKVRAKVGTPVGQYNGYQNGVYVGIQGNPNGVVGNTISFGTNGNHTSPGATPAAGSAQQSGAQTTTPPPAAGNFLLTLPTDDEGVAECVDLRYNGRFLHTESHGWLQYAGTHWKAEGADAAVERAITETLDARIKAALAAGAQNHADLIKRSARNSRGVKAAKAQLQSRAHADIASFDNDPNLLNCPNGVVDLRTGHLRPHSANQRFMYCVAVNYNPNADYVDWSSWLESSTSADAADWLQMAVGYSLTGYTREEVFFYLYGPPRSGKGTFVDAIMKMLGDPVAQATKFSTFTADRGKDDQNFDLAPLKSARFIAASESNANERFNEAKVKNITGGDKIQCAFKHKDSFGYIPMYKVWLSSNSPINADPDDDAVWGRTRLVHFPNSHLGKEDKTLKQRMHSTKGLEAVLAWSVAGAVRWFALGSAGLPELGALSKLKQEQRAELDHIQQWVDECCNTTDPLAFSTNENVHTSYRTWCTDNGVTPKAKKGLTQSLNKKGFVSNSGWIVNPNTGIGKTARGFMGVKINP